MALIRPRSIVHLDADAFFASVEQAADSRLRGKPVAVGGEKRGVIASASYEARKLGIYTPMPTALARRLCPRLIVLPGDFEKYELFSRLMFSYAYDFTPDVEIGSIDEGYFDLTGGRRPAVEVARKIRTAIRQALKLSVSEGVAGNKLVSQIASKLKKPSAFEFVPHGGEAGFLSPLENQWLPGIGPRTSKQLNAAGLARVGHIAATPADLLGLLVGSMAPQLRQFALGIDERPVVPARAAAKSYGEQETFAADTTDPDFIEATLCRMADSLMRKVREEGKSIRTVTVKVRYNDMDEQQAGESLREPTDLETDIYSLSSGLLRKAWQRRVSLRLVSLRLTNIYEGPFRGSLALDVSSRRHEAGERLAKVVDDLREKFGRAALMRGHDFVLRERAGNGHEPGDPAGTHPAAAPNPVRYKLAAVQRQRLANSIARRPEKMAREPGKPLTPTLSLKGRGNPTAPLSPTGSMKGSSQMEAGAGLLVPALPGQGCRRRTPAVSVPLNVHSYYSFLDSTLSIAAIVELARRDELPAIALTDRQNLHGAVEFAQAAAEAGIKPIIGCELDSKGRRFLVYVENQEGYQNLCRILNTIRVENEDSEEAPTARPLPGISPALLECTTGLIGVSPAAELARFFPGRFYLEANSREAFEKRAGLPCVAAFPVHYELPSDRWKYDIVQSIRTLTLLRQGHPEKRFDGGFHYRNFAAERELFTTCPELVAHSLEIAERCAFQFSLGRPQFPAYAPPDGSTPAAFLKKLVMDGLRRRYPRDHARLRPQLEEELAIITEVGYEEYFLVMWDILEECRRRGIDWITRGSAADSLACYALGISGVCPIRFDLYFRRFLNKDRMALQKLPDIDVDFPHDRKDDVVELIFAKYGPAHTAVVGGFSTFQSRSAFAEVAKVLGVAEQQVRRITDRFPYYSSAGELADALAESQECRDLPLDQEPYSTALKMAEFLDGFPRYPKMHPCGLVISRQLMSQITPCFQSAKGYPTTHFDMDAVEAVGLVKMDILAQGGLAVMRDVQQMLIERGAPVSDLEALAPWEDPQVWDLIAGGAARAVHHIESPAMISLCKMCNVRDIDTLIAIVSVIRPGAANESKKLEFARRYQGLSPVHYPHPSLEPCLRSTYGLVVYEEHILQICEAFAGLPPGRADILRRALGKEKTAVIEQIRTEFVACARQLGREEAQIQEVWDLVTGFRGYAFCKAHSTAYGVEAYQAAWLKRYYPAEFMAAVLTNGKGFYSVLVYILECHRLGIALLPPSINRAGPQFSVEDGRIRAPALRVKGLSQRTLEAILKEREKGPFLSLTDFFFRVQPPPEEVDLLIRVGAFDEFEAPRTAQYWEFKALAANRPTGGSPGRRQMWLFPPGNLDRLPQVPLTEPSRLERLKTEEELLGYPASGHPVELFPDIAWGTYCPISRLGEYIGQEIATCGIVIEQRLFHQVTGEPMKFLTIADRTGVIETELFAKIYRSYGLNTVRYRVLEIHGTVEPFENNRGYTLRVLTASKPRERARS